MKKTKKEVNYETTYKLINYDATDITKYCADYLLENNIYRNSPSINLILLESSIINYSISKLKEWDKFDVTIENIEDYTSVENICKKINEILPNDKKERYFMDYAHCINYICGAILRQEKQISLKEVETNIPITIIEETDKYEQTDYIDQIIISTNLENYKIPSEMLNTLKEKYKNEKTLKKTI